MVSNIQERNVNYQSNNKNALYLSACNGSFNNQPFKLINLVIAPAIFKDFEKDIYHA